MPATDEARAIGFGVCALFYASLGYRVVPVERGGKKPHRMLPPTGGVHWASLDPAQIRSWWSEDPAASIGVATGQASALAVIDCDVKGEHNGLESLTSFLTGTPLSTLTGYPVVRTPSGGVHLWMRTPAWAAVPERPSILPGVDAKGDGGLVIVPPSARLIMPDGRDGQRGEPVPIPYLWSFGCPCSVPPAPDWMGSWLATAPQMSISTTSNTDEAPPDITELMQTGIPVGERNHVLYRTACGLFRKAGTTPRGAGVVLDRVLAIWRAGDTTDFSYREVLVCVESARKFIERQQIQERALRMAWQSRG
jgi:Bifunctional DNA primase/polymerase, N-terminal